MNSFVSSNLDVNVDHGDLSSCNNTGNTEVMLGQNCSIQNQIDTICQKMDIWDAALHIPCVQNNFYHSKFDIFSICNSIYKGCDANQYVYLDSCAYSPVEGFDGIGCKGFVKIFDSHSKQ